jgi:hypothetical protein
VVEVGSALDSKEIAEELDSSGRIGCSVGTWTTEALTRREFRVKRVEVDFGIVRFNDKKSG